MQSNQLWCSLVVLTIIGGSTACKIAVLGYHFSVFHDAEADALNEAIAAVSRRSWAFFCAQNATHYELAWRTQADESLRQLAEQSLHPRWYKYRYLAEVLDGRDEHGAPRYCAALYVDADTIWTGDRAAPLHGLLDAYAGATLLVGHSLSFDLATASAPLPELLRYRLDPAVLLVRNTPPLRAALHQLWADVIAKALFDEEPVFRAAFPLQSPDAATLASPASVSLGTAFVARPFFWQPGYFAMHLTADERKPSSLDMLTSLVRLRESGPLTHVNPSLLVQSPTRRKHTMS